MRRSISFLFFLLAALLMTSAVLAQAEPDTDGDGTVDSKDRCPAEAGPSLLQGCPDADSDGVPNIDDACAGLPGIIENRGCPKDSDGDGVGDFEDSCPNDGGPASNGGCPIPPDSPVPTPTPQPEPPAFNPLELPLTGPCVATPYLNGRVNGRAADGAIIAVLEPDSAYPVGGFIARPNDPQPAAYIKYGDIKGDAQSTDPGQPSAAFAPTFTGGVFVATNTLKFGGDCQSPAILIGLLLPAVQKVREAAARLPANENDGFHRLFGDVNGDSVATYEVSLTGILIGLLQGAQDGASASGSGGGAGKATFQDLHFSQSIRGILIGMIVQGEDGDTVEFDLTNSPDTAAAADFLLTLDTVEGESSELPPAPGAILWLLNQLTKFDSTNDIVREAASCEEQVFDQLAALGATAHVVPTSYGAEFMVRLPEGAQEPSDPCAGPASVNLYHLRWTASEDGSTQAPLLKVGRGALVFANGVGIGFDGSLCVDLQPDGAEPLCLPAVQ